MAEISNLLDFTYTNDTRGKEEEKKRKRGQIYFLEILGPTGASIRQPDAKLLFHLPHEMISTCHLVTLNGVSDKFQFLLWNRLANERKCIFLYG